MDNEDAFLEKMTFRYIINGKTIKYTIDTSGVTRDEVLEEFELFLQGVGYREAPPKQSKYQ